MEKCPFFLYILHRFFNNRLFLTRFDLIYVLFFMVLVSALQAQPGALLNSRADFSCQYCTPSEALLQLSHQTGIAIVFTGEIFAGCYPVKITAVNEPVKEIIKKITQPCQEVVLTEGNNAIILKKAASVQYLISGEIRDLENGELLPEVNIAVVRSYDNEVIVRTSSNNYGKYALQLPEGSFVVIAQYLGYKTQKMLMYVNRQDKRDFFLDPQREILSPVDITANERDYQIKSPNGAFRLPTHLRSVTPAPGGANGLQNIATQTPGVLTGVDGIGGLFVRGGNNDHNLILLDDVPIYNPTHAVGLYSVINRDIVKSQQLWKGDIPAKYGGRAASVVDIRTREGNTRQWSGGATASLVDISGFVEGPVKKDSSGLLLSFKHSLIQPWANRYAPDSALLGAALGQLKYRFYDVSAKYHWQINARHKLFLGYYSSNDHFGAPFSRTSPAAEDETFYHYDTLASNWGNDILSLRWNHSWSEKTYSNITLIYSNFNYSSQLRHITDKYGTGGRITSVSNYAQVYQSYIRDIAMRHDISVYPNNRLQVATGYSVNFHRFRPGALAVNYLLPGTDALVLDSLSRSLQKNKILNATEAEIYGDMNWQFLPHWQCYAGINNAFFSTPARWYKTFSPRLRLQHGENSGWSQWISWHQLTQFLHQIGNYNIGLPFELWVPSTEKVKPEIVRQTVVGTGWANQYWAVCVEAYHKRMLQTLALLNNNQTLLAGGAQDSNGWEEAVAGGTGYSQGVELCVEKKSGRVSGTLAYTLSRSVRRFDDLNQGRYFPFQFDRPHNIKVVINGHLLKGLDISASWTYMSGNPITLALEKYQQDNQIIYIYKSLNGFRLRDAHRMDVVLDWRFSLPEGVNHRLQAGIYNVYNRHNPFYLIVDTGSGLPNRAIEYTLLPFHPTLSYTLIF